MLYRRYYIGSQKLAELGWKEKTTWEVGLKRTLDWYVNLGPKSKTYWNCSDVEAALEPHPTMTFQEKDGLGMDRLASGA